MEKNKTFAIRYRTPRPSFLLFQMNLVYMKRILHFVQIKNIIVLYNITDDYVVK